MRRIFLNVFGTWEEICIDNNKKLLMQSSAFYSLIAIVAIIMAAGNIRVKAYSMLLATLAILAASAGCLAIQIIKKKYNVFLAIIFTVIIYICGGYFLISGGTEGFSAFWIVIFAPVTFVICPRKVAAFFVMSGFLVILLFFYTPLYELCWYDYSDFFDKRFPVLLSLSIWLTFTYEIMNGKTQNLLINVNRSLEEMAMKDTLTGLLNRRGFARAMDEALSAARRHKDLKLFFLLIDIDHFKQINDTYGHNTGDDVLVGIASVLDRITRSSDSAFRWGGEEFLLLIKAQEDNDVKLVAEKIHKEIQEVVIIRETEIHFTVSIGFHVYDTDLSVSQNVNMTDSYLYKAKQTGRNKVFGQEDEIGNFLN